VVVSDGFDSGNANSVVNVTNVAPSLSVGADATLNEGDLFARSGSFTDPGADTWTATVNYGDGGGAQALALAGKNFNLAHTYLDNGLNTVKVVVTDDDAGVGSDDAAVTVNNVAPTVEAGPNATVDSGQTYNFNGMFSDPGILDAPWAWVIEWGFGPNTTGSTNDQSSAVAASRQVCVAGAYTVHLAVTDKDAGSGADELTLTVPFVQVGLDIMPGTAKNPLSLKANGTLTVAVLGSAQINLTTANPSTFFLGDEIGTDIPVSRKKDGRYDAQLQDVNNDGFMDLRLQFSQRDLVDNGDLTKLSTALVIRGFLGDGCTNVRGTNAVTIVGG
jgi:hypothetical protein